MEVRRDAPPATAIRTVARVLIIEHGYVLALRFEENGGFAYVLPGGGQEVGENLESAVRRECVEEIGVAVAVHELVFVREGLRDRPQRLVFFFRCSLPPGVVPQSGTTPDAGQVGVEWLPVSDLSRLPLIPEILRTALPEYCAGVSVPIYLGDTR